MEGRSGRRLRKLRIAAAFRSSLSSCGSRNPSNSLPDSVFLPQPPPLPRPSFDYDLPDLGFLNTSSNSCGGGCSRVAKCASEMMLPRQISDRYLSSAKEDSRHILQCPPASPITPLNPFLRHQFTPDRAAGAYDQSSSSSSAAREVGKVRSSLFLRSSEDEGDGGTSSESSSSETTIDKRTGKAGMGRVEEGTSYAVVKRSRDPYGDFRRSMVEMIVEKKMYGAGDMERLLEWFLLLNEGRHHAVILRAFTDIWESLYYL
ncbi:hypothetical protein MLD38_014794 [Melastoma candidum]|uniref:Uncharacterized protein n=1 Tax=Melastoma candidum TaxID=119954 RepID=A0ACB9RDX9_9MYRT|nr:hypothetical protein MLD38_014794 [Melastoma candidum]